MGEEKKEQKKLSYEELANAANQLQQQNKFLIEQLQKNQGEAFYKRLDYLFEVIKFKEVFPEEFIGACIDEIVSTITIPEDIQDQSTIGANCPNGEPGMPGIDGISGHDGIIGGAGKTGPQGPNGPNETFSVDKK